MDPLKFKTATAHFDSTTEEEKELLMKQRNAKNTNRATKSSLNCLMNYLIEKEMPTISETSDDDLPHVLIFYTNMRTKITSDYYNTQTLKCMRSNLSRIVLNNP